MINRRVVIHRLPLEGINRKIKTLKRTCYGFANQKFFFLRIDCIFS